MDPETIKDFVIPAAGILVPTALAIWLTRSERNAAEKDRIAENVRREEDRVDEGVEHALDAMSALVEAGYTNDIQRAAAIRIRAARLLSRIYSSLGSANAPVASWLALELGVVAQGLEERDEVGLPVELEKITWRSAHFTDVITDWRTGEKETTWFSHAPHPPLSDTEAYLPE